MGGRVGFRSTPGDGSVFWIDLPAHDAKTSVAPAAPLPFKPASVLVGSSQDAAYTVVYIEDNPSNIAFMQGLIGELERVNLVCAPTAELGIEIVRAHRPDVVIMDINLPGMSGHEATRHLKAWPETKDIPVIALTAAAMAGDRKRASDVGFYRYLTKPVKVAELMETLEVLFSLPRPPRTPNPSAP